MRILFEWIFLLDVQTLLILLLWEGIISSVIIGFLWKQSTYPENRDLVYKAITFRLLCAAGFFLIAMRDRIPIVLSSTVGNCVFLSEDGLRYR